MRNSFDIFDAIYCVNLDRNTARWKRVSREFQKMGIGDRVVRYSAIEDIQNGARGCALSHQNILKNAQKNGYNNILIFEDDAYLMSSLGYLLWVLKDLSHEKWDMLYFGGIIPVQRGGFQRVSPYLAQISQIWGTIAVAYQSSTYADIINIPVDTMMQKYGAYDAFLMTFHDKIRVLTSQKPCIYQAPGVSDITSLRKGRVYQFYAHMSYFFMRNPVIRKMLLWKFLPLFMRKYFNMIKK